LKYVINYDFPSNIEQYCHRIGRVGRQGEEGEAYSLMTRNFAPLANDLIALLKRCGKTPEPNLEKLALDYSLGKMLDDIDDSLEE
jgi:ATP-dependent RNA helicase DDX5/DBP2